MSIIAYASRTGTTTTLDSLRKHDWRLLVSACGKLFPYDFKFIVDNGAWTAFQQKRSFDHGAFERAVWSLSDRADWTVVPDVVGEAKASLRLTEHYLPLLDRFRLAVAVQDGMTSDDVAPWLGPSCGLFLGGSTEWKLQTMGYWGMVAKERNCHYHVARVNSPKRIKLARKAGAHSFDGSGPTRFPANIPGMDAARFSPL